MSGFTVEEINLICIFNQKSRIQLLDALRSQLDSFDDDLRDIADSAIRKLNGMTDVEFSTMQFYPAYEEEYPKDDEEVEE
jgi:hypothetical protein